MLQNGLRFGQAYFEVDVHSAPDGSLVVNFGGASSQDVDEEFTEQVGGGSSEPGESLESHAAEGEVGSGESQHTLTQMPDFADNDTGCFHTQNVGSRDRTEETKVINSGTVEESAKACQEWCESMDDCTLFVYNKNSNTCFAKKGRPVLYEYTGDITGARSCDSSCFVKDVAYGKAAEVAPRLETRMVSDCQAACAAEPRCKVFIWHASENKCYLKGEGFSKFKEQAEGTIAGPKLSCGQGGSLAASESEDRQSSAGGHQ